MNKQLTLMAPPAKPNDAGIRPRSPRRMRPENKGNSRFEDLLSGTKVTEEVRKEVKTSSVHAEKQTKEQKSIKTDVKESRKAQVLQTETTVQTAEAGSRKVLIEHIAVALMQDPVLAEQLGFSLSEGTSGLQQELQRRNTESLKNFLVLVRAGTQKQAVENPVSGSAVKEMIKNAFPEQQDKGTETENRTDDDNFFKIAGKGTEKKVLANPRKVIIVDNRTGRQNDGGFQQSLVKGSKMPESDEAKLRTVELKADGPVSHAQSSLRETVLKARTAPVPQVNASEMVNRVVRFAKVMLGDKKSVMQIDLKPAHLGRILLKIELVDNAISARISTTSEGAGDLLKQNMGNLHQAFKEAGLNLKNLDVNAGSSDRDEPAAKPAGQNRLFASMDTEGEDLLMPEAYDSSVFASRQAVDYTV